MTTTSTYTGIENVSKPTSRVLHPPGGKTSFSLGGYGEEPAPQEVKKPTLEDVDPEKQEQEQDDATKETSEQAVKPAGDSFGNLFGPTKSNNLPRGRRRFPQQLEIMTGHNPVTGETNERGASDEAPDSKGRAKAADRVDPSTLPAAGGRVEGRTPMKRQPPGGKDSGIFS